MASATPIEIEITPNTAPLERILVLLSVRAGEISEVLQRTAVQLGEIRNAAADDAPAPGPETSTP
jgi:hypothetical protein